MLRLRRCGTLEECFCGIGIWIEFGWVCGWYTGSRIRCRSGTSALRRTPSCGCLLQMAAVLPCVGRSSCLSALCVPRREPRLIVQLRFQQQLCEQVEAHTDCDVILRVLAEARDDQAFIGGVTGAAVGYQEQVGLTAGQELHHAGQASSVRSGATLPGELLCRGAAEDLVERLAVAGLFAVLHQITQLAAFQLPAEVQKLAHRDIDLDLVGLALPGGLGQVIAGEGEVEPAEGEAVSQAFDKAILRIFSSDLILVALILHWEPPPVRPSDRR